MRVAIIRRCLLYSIAAFYLAAGILHFASTADFALITPDWVPRKYLVVQATGACEIAGAIGLMSARFRKAAGLALALYAMCVFPANIKHAFEHIDVPGLPSGLWYHAPRFVFQPLLIWATLFCVGATNWPFGKSRAPIKPN